MVNFDSAPATFAELLAASLGADAAENGRLVRDVYGRLAFVTRRPLDEKANALSRRAAEALGAYAVSASRILVSLADDEPAYKVWAGEPSIGIPAGADTEFRMIDRRVAEGEWLMPAEPIAQGPGRLIFHSIKGGVGRSTALAITAADLAARGYNVLVIDMDLEAPGQGTLLLPPGAVPKFGVVDWFAAVAAGADAERLLHDMVGQSAFTSGRAVVDVVPAAGGNPGDYISKLARAYMPGSSGQDYAGFGYPRKARHLVKQLLALRAYDAVLIDARAGLHETSGALLLGLGARTLLFGVDTDQTFEDYRIMFGAFRQALDPIIGGEDFRPHLKMVHAKAPRDVAERAPFQERSWNLWSETLYDIDPGSAEAIDPYVFDLGDDSAPHYPLEIVGDETYARFNPRSQTYAMSSDAYAPVFGGFLAGVREMLGLS